MSQEHEVARLDDLPPGELFEVTVEGTSMCLARLRDGSVHAFANLCSHEPTPLSDGYLDGGEVECPAHGSRFDVRDGRALCEPAREPIRCFSAHVLDGAVIAEIDPEDSADADLSAAHQTAALPGANDHARRPSGGDSPAGVSTSLSMS
jgi:3-phenylpropionate/trans-cinnamate dioxygenase ferredoxin component